MEVLISRDMYEISIPLLIRNDSLSLSYESFKRGYHMYMSLLLGECLFGKKEPSNRVEKNAVTVICRHSCGREVVGHVPQDIAKVVLLYLSLPHFYLELEVTGKHVNHEGGYGLEILARFCLYRPEKATQWLETRLTKTEEQ